MPPCWSSSSAAPWPAARSRCSSSSTSSAWAGRSTVAQLGRNVAQQAERAAALGEQAALLAAAAPLVKPLVLARRHDAALLAATWGMYRYTLTLDPGFAVAGALAGLVVNAGVWAALGWIGRIARARPG